MSRLLLLSCLLLSSVAMACLRTGNDQPPTAPTPLPSTHLDLRSIATVSGTPAATALSAADQATAIIDVLPLTQQQQLQVLLPLHFSTTSTIDMLRLSASAGLPPASGSAMLVQTGLTWLTEAQLITKPAPAYAQLRVLIAGFATSAGASHYLDRPLLLPGTLRDSTATRGPAMLGPSAQSRQASDSLTRTDQPGTVFSGERRALLWQRGQLLLDIEVAGDPGQFDEASLLALASRLDQNARAVPGFSPP